MNKSCSPLAFFPKLVRLPMHSKTLQPGRTWQDHSLYPLYSECLFRAQSSSDPSPPKARCQFSCAKPSAQNTFLGSPNTDNLLTKGFSPSCLCFLSSLLLAVAAVVVLAADVFHRTSPPTEISDLLGLLLSQALLLCEDPGNGLVAAPRLQLPSSHVRLLK